MLKARKLIGMMYTQFYWANTSVLQSTYITYIHPHLEYAAQLWDPHVKRDIQVLESVLTFACKVCLKCCDMDYDNMLHCFDLPLLCVRCQHLKLITMFNIINGNNFFQQVSSIYTSISHRETIHLHFTDPILAPTTSYVPSIIAF